ncbi:MAG TPA: MoaD/ThiS family protein [Pyrinomonadaceae bacterium]|nr:MoaD/ThiS family protein [Pyrinomonadaceae bacterium]
MQVRVLFFGATADAVGDSEVTLDIGSEATLGDLVQFLKTSNARLAQMKLLSAVNEEYAETRRTLMAGDRVALFTAVSGG